MPAILFSYAIYLLECVVNKTLVKTQQKAIIETPEWRMEERKKGKEEFFGEMPQGAPPERLGKYHQDFTAISFTVMLRNFANK